MSEISFDMLMDHLAEKFPDPETFRFGEFNLLKIAQHAIESSARKKKVLQRPYFLLPPILHDAAMAGLRLKSKYVSEGKSSKIAALSKKPTLLYAGGNIVIDESGDWVSSNTARILPAIGRQNCCYVYNPSGRESVNTGQDLDGPDIVGVGSRKPLNLQQRVIKRDLATCFRQIKISSRLTRHELHHLAAHIQNFFQAFRDWWHVLEKVKPERVLFYPHYHNEGLVAACRLLNIESIELQHGLISAEDYYYVYPQRYHRVISHSLFADRIWVFGDYWKRELSKGLGYPPEKINVIGRYQYHPPVTLEAKEAFIERHDLARKKVIAIACQTNMPDYYANYTECLAEMIGQPHPDWVIVIKPHPRQLGMDRLKECTRFANVRMMDKTENLMTLLALTSIQISIYSTTFFDAIGLPVVNFSLQDNERMAAYASSMVEAGIARPLMPNQNPIESVAAQIKESGLNPADVYSVFEGRLPL